MSRMKTWMTIAGWSFFFGLIDVMAARDVFAMVINSGGALLLHWITEEA